MTITNTFSACRIDFSVGRINLAMFGKALTSRYSGHCGSFRPFSRYDSDSTSPSQSSLLSFWNGFQDQVLANGTRHDQGRVIATLYRHAISPSSPAIILPIKYSIILPHPHVGAFLSIVSYAAIFGYTALRYYLC